jgi:3-phosphoshikimate 1-carboxyvinyltransferase
MKQGLRLRLRGKLASLPYIRMTTRLMAAYGVQVEFREDTLTVRPQEYKALPFRVEADWSAASYWFALLAVCGEGRVLLRGLSPDSLQGDALVARLFQGLGVDSRFIGEGLLLQAVPRSCQRMDYDFTNEPDLAQTFVVACCLMNLPFSFTGLHSLKIKETDRIDALCRELHKLGYPLSAEGEGRLEWTGERCPAEAAPRIATYADHRMAMAFAPAAFAYPQGGLTIENPQVVSKSYPRFWNDLRSAAFQLVEN